MVDIPKNVLDLLSASDAVKILVTSDKSSLPHAIVCGSIFVLDPKTLGAGEVLTKVSSKNLEANGHASVLVVRGLESYIIKVKVKKRETSGPVLEQLNQQLAKIKLKAGAVWIFDVESVFNQSANPEAGKKLA